MHLEFSAQQVGLPSYHWTIFENGVPVADVDGTSSVLSRVFNRPSSASPDLNVQVILQTTNFTDCQSPVNVQNLVVPNDDEINASFTADPLTQTFPNSTVDLVNNTNPGPWEYLWDFGDGDSSSERDAGSHTYETFGTYVITLTVTNNVCVEVHMETVEIEPIPPLVDFSYDPPNGCLPLTVNFTNLSQYADADSYVWEFGEGQATSNAISPTYTYFQPGKYTVSLSATNISGVVVKETKEQIIEVFPRPSAHFEIRPSIVYLPEPLFTNNQSFNATSYEWNFGDGTTSIDFEPQHVYQKEGDYSIQLIAYNSFGCRDTTVMDNAVKAVKSGQVLIPNAFSPGGGSGGLGDGKNDLFLPLTRQVTNFHMMIFNRWGELLFESLDPTIGWNGYHNGKLCQQDVYVYKVTGQYENGVPFVRVGDVNLIR
jgi:gliding motility-associated-like protein